ELELLALDHDQARTRAGVTHDRSAFGHAAAPLLLSICLVNPLRSGDRKTVMAMENSPDGDSLPGRSNLDALFSATYEELRHLAQRVRSRESSLTLSPTVL